MDEKKIKQLKEIQKGNKIINIKENPKLVKKLKKDLLTYKKQASKSILAGKGFVLINIGENGKAERFVASALKPNELILMVTELELTALTIFETLKDIPCDCPKCKNKFSGVN